MTWRIHLANQAIQQLDILTSKKQTLLAAWSQRDRASYFDLDSGVTVGEHQHSAVARQSEKWGDFITALVSPNGVYLPRVQTATFTLLTTTDGKTRLSIFRDGRLMLEADSKEVPLEVPEGVQWHTFAFDPALGAFAALDAKAKLHIYQQQIAVGVFDLKLKPSAEWGLHLAISEGAAQIFVALGQELLRVDSGGKVQKRLKLHYAVGRLACSPDGKRLVTSDAETGVLRVYEGSTLVQTHQRHADDLLHKAAQLQLIADFPPRIAAPNTLALTNKGQVCFSVSGVVCMTTLKQLDALPRG